MKPKNIKKARSLKKDESAALFSSILNIVHDAVIAIDQDHNIVLFNQGAMRTFGYDASEVIGRPLDILLPQGLSEIHHIHVHAFAESEVDARMMGERQEISGRRKNGELFPAEANIAKVSNNGQTIFAAILRDVTERKQAEAEKLEAQKFYRILFEESPDAIFIADLEGRYQMVNARAAQMLGYTLDEMRELSVKDTSAQLPESLKIIERLSNGEAIPPFERMIRKKNGEIIPVEIRLTLIHNSQGRPYRVQSITRDITERKQAEAEKQEAQKFYRVLFEESPDAVFILDLEGHHQEVNARAAQMLGYTLNEMQELSVQDLSAQLPESMKIIKRLLNGETIPPYERMFRKKNGEIILVEIHLALIRDGRGKPYRIQSIARDITERKQAEAALQDHEQRMEEVVNAAPFGAHIYDLNAQDQLILIDANRSADLILQTGHNQLVGKTIEESFPATQKTELLSEFKRVARQGGKYDAENFTYTDGNINGSFEVHAVQIAPERIAVFFRDVTELSHAYDMTLEGWSRALDLRDKETAGHTQRVTRMTVQLARAMGLSESEILHIQRGALLHDIGKMGVPDHILLKPGKLTEAEREIMRKHPEYAYEMLFPIIYLRPALDIPYCHHEKWDGSGYPRGLKGEQIPLSARLFAIVDVWDALRSNRPYRETWTEEKVREYIISQIGTHFDPAIAALFLQTIDGV